MMEYVIRYKFQGMHLTEWGDMTKMMYVLKFIEDHDDSEFIEMLPYED